MTKQNIYIIALFLLFLSCNKDKANDPQIRPNGLENSFYMEIDSLNWEPTQMTPGLCNSAFIGEWSGINDIEIYQLTAYKDSAKQISFKSQNFFTIQIFDVKGIGVYEMDKFEIGSLYSGSYAYFVINYPGNYKTYMAKKSNNKASFFVEIKELKPRKGSALKTMKANFYGTLYNKDNDNDSIVISNGSFDIKRPNGSFRHCSE